MTWPETRSKRGLWITVGAALIVLVAALVWRNVTATGTADHSSAAPTAPAADQSSEPTVVLTAAAVQRAGIVAMPLAAVPYRHEIAAYGSVVDVQALAAARVGIAAAQAAAVGAAATARSARQELERTRTLHADDQNASTRALEAAVAAARGASADEAATRAAESAQTAAVIQAWGPVVGRWAVDGSAAFDRLLTRHQVLVLLSVASDTGIAAPPASVAVWSSGPSVKATYVSPATRVDPRIQGLAYFYIATAAPSLLPGTNVSAPFPIGAPVSAVNVPRSAVVWAEGGAWVYVRTGPTTFVRRRIATDAATRGGYAVTTLRAGTVVVTQGAQVLFSQESRPQAPAAATADLDG